MKKTVVKQYVKTDGTEVKEHTRGVTKYPLGSGLFDNINEEIKQHQLEIIFNKKVVKVGGATETVKAREYALLECQATTEEEKQAQKDLINEYTKKLIDGTAGVAWAELIGTHELSTEEQKVVALNFFLTKATSQEFNDVFTNVVYSLVGKLNPNLLDKEEPRLAGPGARAEDNQRRINLYLCYSYAELLVKAWQHRKKQVETVLALRPLHQYIRNGIILKVEELTNKKCSINFRE